MRGETAAEPLVVSVHDTVTSERVDSELLRQNARRAAGNVSLLTAKSPRCDSPGDLQSVCGGVALHLGERLRGGGGEF